MEKNTSHILFGALLESTLCLVRNERFQSNPASLASVFLGVESTLSRTLVRIIILLFRIFCVEAAVFVF